MQYLGDSPHSMTVLGSSAGPPGPAEATRVVWPPGPINAATHNETPVPVAAIRDPQVSQVVKVYVPGPRSSDPQLTPISCQKGAPDHDPDSFIASSGSGPHQSWWFCSFGCLQDPHSLDLLHQQIHHGPQAPALAQVGALRQAGAGGPVLQERPAVHNLAA
jgi:hypothetical protein